MEKFPVRHTERLLLRKIEIEDVPALVYHANNKKIADRILNIPFPYQELNAVFRINYVVSGFAEKSRYVFAIILAETNKLIGEISLHLERERNLAELGYWLGEEYWNRGLCSEAVGEILSFGFHMLGLDLIYATSHQQNIASERVLQKHEFQAHSSSGKVIQYRLTKETYEKGTEK